MEQITQNGMTMQRMEGQEAQDYMNSLLMEVAGTDTMIRTFWLITTSIPLLTSQRLEFA